MPSNRQLRQRRTGLKVVGPGYYVWDADSREALRLASELSQGRRAQPLPQNGALQRRPLR